MSIQEMSIVYWVLVVIIAAFAGITLLKLWRVDFGGLIQETNSQKASLSRFQFLLFTFIIAGLYLVLCLDTGDFIAVPESVLGLLGISGGSYLVSKGISANTAGQEVHGNPAPQVPAPQNPPQQHG